MSDLNQDLEQEEFLENSEIGRQYLFWNRDYPDDSVLRFSSTIAGISEPSKFDRKLKNKTVVLVLGDPEEAYHPIAKQILVSKVLAADIMFVPTLC